LTEYNVFNTLFYHTMHATATNYIFRPAHWLSSPRLHLHPRRPVYLSFISSWTATYLASHYFAGCVDTFLLEYSVRLVFKLRRIDTCVIYEWGTTTYWI